MSKSLLPKDIASQKAFNFNMPKLNQAVPDAALGVFERARDRKNDFRMAETTKLKTGVSELEQESVQEAIEHKTLEKLKDVQENAYKEAFQLGLLEGRKQAFDEASKQINESLERFENLITSMKNLKTELLSFNESHLIQLMFHMATRIAHREIDMHQDVVVEVIRQAVDKARTEEEMAVQVCPAQIEFLETLKKETSREFEFIKKIKLIPNESVSIGGCIVETNYGEVDSRFEERVGKLWEALLEVLPKSKDKISAA